MLKNFHYRWSRRYWASFCLLPAAHFLKACRCNTDRRPCTGLSFSRINATPPADCQRHTRLGSRGLAAELSLQRLQEPGAPKPFLSDRGAMSFSGKTWPPQRGPPLARPIPTVRCRPWAKTIVSMRAPLLPRRQNLLHGDGTVFAQPDRALQTRGHRHPPRPPERGRECCRTAGDDDRRRTQHHHRPQIRVLKRRTTRWRWLWRGTPPTRWVCACRPNFCALFAQPPGTPIRLPCACRKVSHWGNGAPARRPPGLPST